MSEPGLATGGVVTTSNDDDDDDNDNDNDVVVDYPCVRLPKSSNALITDFREIELGTAWESGQEKWGTSNGLNGGTFHYQGDGDSLRATRVDSGLGLTGIVPAGSYAGFGLWFVNCIDASDFDGISFSLAGDTDGVTLRFQLQMNSNYPIDTANSKGACAYSSEETKWDECTNNSVRASQIDAVERDYSYTWDRFVGGQPVSPLNPREIMGLQWQFDCEADTDCSVDLTIGDLWFFQLV